MTAAGRYSRRLVLTADHLVLPSGVVHRGRLVVEGSRIAENADAARESDVTFDFPGCWIVPGFVDVHVHGGGGASYSTVDPAEALTVAELHRRHGTTTTVASLVTGVLDELERQAAALAELVQQGELAGVHFEGPFISKSRCGAHEPGLLRDPDPEDVARLVRASHGSAKMMTLAPELPGALESIRYLRDQGVIAAVGHTEASYDVAKEAVEAGATAATHLFNTMPSIDANDPGPVPVLLRDSRVTVELINDGIHLHSSTVNLALRAAGSERVAFITDAMGAAGMGDGLYPLGPMQVRVDNGVARLVKGGAIAGSTLTLDTAYQRAITVNGLSPLQATQVLSVTPAKMIGMYGSVGSLEAGKYADLVVMDEHFELKGVMRRGEWFVKP